MDLFEWSRVGLEYMFRVGVLVGTTGYILQLFGKGVNDCHLPQHMFLKGNSVYIAQKPLIMYSHFSFN